MAPRKRDLKKRVTTLSADAQAWLRGEPCGFFKFKRPDALAAVWNTYGDHDSMFWNRGMMLPITIEELEANEDAWLNSGEDDEYGSCSFIHKHYSDEEKQELWSERGDKSRFKMAARNAEFIS